MNQDDAQNDYDRPVAYDAEGRPLYTHPVTEEQVAETSGLSPSVVHVARPLEPNSVEISPDLKAKHDRSVQRFPQLDLSAHEYVILSVRRHPIGLIAPFAVAIIMMCIVLTSLILLPELFSAAGVATSNIGIVYLIGFALIALLGVGMYVLYWVYIHNKFFLTNESIVEETQISLFSNNVKSVGLEDVVDVSYRKTGIVEQLFNFGTVQVGTKDDETPYIFHMVSNPKSQASVLKEAVECFKGGRPVGQSLESIEALG